MSYKPSLFKKLSQIQLRLMGMTIPDTLEELLPIIFQECLKENVTFYFNFIEDTATLNLRDFETENTELNVRLHYKTEPNMEFLKKQLLLNTFLLTPKARNVASSDKKEAEPMDILSSEEVMPTSIRKAVEKLQKKGVPVTVDAIRNHLPLGQMSNSNKIQCNNYLKKMEASQ